MIDCFQSIFSWVTTFFPFKASIYSRLLGLEQINMNKNLKFFNKVKQQKLFKALSVNGRLVQIQNILIKNYYNLSFCWYVTKSTTSLISKEGEGNKLFRLSSLQLNLSLCYIIHFSDA